ncbi:MAG TPA: aminotransferase class V-fold PLP-dependent enzyme [Candidatus Limnocylindrales bacterium]|nr:aminotransferase class V-fold PLP-dependent enzyme [Candidatus Limnocylindrales bacterium]
MPFDRAPWRLDPDVSFLNHGAHGAVPDAVLEAQRAWRDRMEANPVRFLARELPDLLDETRRDVAAFLGADPAGLVFVPNATTGVSTVLGSLRFEPGDELLTTDHEYNATLNALSRAAARDGATVVVARIPFPLTDPSQAVDAIVGAVSPRTRLALVSHVTSPTALVLPIGAIVRELDRRGVDTVVDAAHAPGLVPLDVDALGAAYWTGNGHKWLCAPKGSGMLHVRSDLRDRIRPLVISHGFNDPRTDRPGYHLTFDWTGTADPSAILATSAAIRFVGALDAQGWTGLMAANRELARRGRDAVASRMGITPPAPEGMLGAMAALPLPGRSGEREAERLQRALTDEERIEVPIVAWPVRAARSPGSGATANLVRISAQRYNRLTEYERLGDVLADRIRADADRRRGR